MKHKKYPKEKKKKERHSIPLKRKVHINEKEWRWEFDGFIKILSPENKYYSFRVQEVSGSENFDEFKETYTITPGIIKNFILKNILKNGND